ncbi:hypothetical protein CVT24_003223 [Panaeolus cyanescens]|uniref:Uncharacterized protein n=1 Tax=Panaeolus cyanescens TaxID=181874 RepID=A0A409VFU4_9AGAR|nr:hypothetical protein CVT24_003223 [Panaeolus cyanescens]
MFNLIRRISYGVIPRPDRPWEEDLVHETRVIALQKGNDTHFTLLLQLFPGINYYGIQCADHISFGVLATSNAPRTQRKRRLSSTERDVDGDDGKLNQKKLRTESETPSVADAAPISPTASVPLAQNETQEVKEVTEGVKEVDLEDKHTDGLSEEQPAPESVPLPEVTSDELEETAAAQDDASSAASSRQGSVAPQEGGSDTAATTNIAIDQDEEAASAVEHDATLSEKTEAGKKESVDSAEVQSTTVKTPQLTTAMTKD